MQLTVWALIYFVVGILCFIAILYSTKYLRKIMSFVSVIVILLLMMLWSFFTGTELLMVNLSDKIFWTRICYIAYTLLVPSWLLFIATFTSKKSQHRHPFIIGTYLLYVFFLVMNWTNPYNLFYTNIELVYQGDISFFSATYGPMFWVYTAFSYSFTTFFSVWLLISAKKKRIKRRHAAVMLVAVLTPVLMNFPYIFKLIDYDTTALGFVVSCTMLIVLHKEKFFQRMPLSKTHILEILYDGLIILDDDFDIVEMNEVAKSMLNIEKSDNPKESAKAMIESWFLETGLKADTMVYQTISGLTTRHYRITLRKIALVNTNINNYCILIQDETPLFNARERVSYLEKFDAATGLYNRQFFLSNLEADIHTAIMNKTSLALIVLQINNYQDYSYIYGTTFGNKITIQVGKIIKNFLRNEDIISAFSENEIYISLSIPNNSSLSDNDIRVVDTTLDRIKHIFEEPILVDNVLVKINITAGVAIAPKHETSCSKLIGNAIIAKKQALSKDSFSYQIYNEAIGEKYNRFIRLENDLRHGITNNEFFLLYQPQVDSRTNRVIGIEALVRWDHKDLGLISPADFIPLAEETGQIIELGMWVFTEAAKEMKRLEKLGINDIIMSVNLSIRQLSDPTFSQKVIEIIKREHINPKRLEFEITESIALMSESLGHNHITNLRNIGVRIAMDDFGMGHSSLTYLKRVKIDTVKLDYILTADILTSKTSVALIKSIQNLCESLNIDIVVEHIDNIAQVDKLKELLCFVIQGYVYSPPLDSKSVTKYIKSLNYDDNNFLNKELEDEIR